MGSTDTGSFDKGWLFARCGLQPDGTGIKESQQVMSVWKNFVSKTFVCVCAAFELMQLNLNTI